jgi:hypothetical protein
MHHGVEICKKGSGLHVSTPSLCLPSFPANISFHQKSVQTELLEVAEYIQAYKQWDHVLQHSIN